LVLVAAKPDLKLAAACGQPHAARLAAQDSKRRRISRTPTEAFSKIFVEKEI
jgi:hypothetical protein